MFFNHNKLFALQTKSVFHRYLFDFGSVVCLGFVFMCWLLLLHGISWLMVWSAQNLCREWQWQWSYAQQTWLTAGEERFCLSLHTVDTWNWSVYETFVYRFIIGRCVRVIGVVRQRKTANFAYVEFCGLCITRHSATDGGVDGKHWFYYYYFFFLLLL